MLNKERKKAIENFKYWIQTNTERGVCTIPDYICINALNLLEKQQKEIEEQNKEINEKDKLLKFSRNYINKLEQDLFENANNYVVSKEAIREKIEEIEDSLKEDCIALHEFQRLAKIDVLKELLGE